MLRSLRHCIKRLCLERRATAATEFAIILPVLLMMWAGMTELARGIDEWRKLTLLARTLADLTGQGDTQNPISSSLMNDIVSSSAAVMRPFDISKLNVVVSAMGVGVNGGTLIPTVCSSIANANAVARSNGSAADLVVPLGYQTVGMRYVQAEVSIVYTPMIGSTLARLISGIGNSITLTSNVPWPTRGGKTYGANTYKEVVLPASNAKACDGSAPDGSST